MKTVTKEVAKSKVDSVIGELPENVVVLVSLRKIKNDAQGNPQVQLELAQSRSLSGGRVSLLAALNAGDKRFNSGRTTMRVWPMVNKKGFMSVFNTIEDFDFEEAYKMAVAAKEGEVVAIMRQIETVSVNGMMHPVKIVCLETTDVEKLPKSLREQMADPDVDQDIKERNILQTGGTDSEHIVDSIGNKIYRRYEVQFGDTAKDELIEGKVLLSELTKTKSTVVNTASKLENSLRG